MPEGCYSLPRGWGWGAGDGGGRRGAPGSCPGPWHCWFWCGSSQHRPLHWPQIGAGFLCSRPGHLGQPGASAQGRVRPWVRDPSAHACVLGCQQSVRIRPRVQHSGLRLPGHRACAPPSLPCLVCLGHARSPEGSVCWHRPLSRAGGHRRTPGVAQHWPGWWGWGGGLRGRDLRLGPDVHSPW